jgi:hypothetical protein
LEDEISEGFTDKYWRLDRSTGLQWYWKPSGIEASCLGIHWVQLLLGVHLDFQGSPRALCWACCWTGPLVTQWGPADVEMHLGSQLRQWPLQSLGLQLGLPGDTVGQAEVNYQMASRHNGTLGWWLCDGAAHGLPGRLLSSWRYLNRWIAWLLRWDRSCLPGQEFDFRGSNVTRPGHVLLTAAWAPWETQGPAAAVDAPRR